MPVIPLNKGLVTLVDPDDYEKFKHYKWYAHKTSYGTYMAARTYKENGKRKFQYLHRAIMNPPEGYVIDHINGDTLDNRKENLRICTRAENNCNMHRYKSRKKAVRHSLFKGVYWDNHSNKWQAQIRVNKRTITIGRFESEQEAAWAYDFMALYYFGEFARPNFVKLREGVQTCPSIDTRPNLRNSFLEQSGNLLEAPISSQTALSTNT